eukprot:SAG31_NODE_4592_length_3107_cov_9.144729_5_plen_68_part_01
MGYLSFQGAGASTADTDDYFDGINHPDGASLAAPVDRDQSGQRRQTQVHGAPWCVNTWGPDLDPVPVL